MIDEGRKEGRRDGLSQILISDNYAAFDDPRDNSFGRPTRIVDFRVDEIL